MVYVISDTHFLHDNIINYCDRPQNHNQIMIKNWVSVVKPEDTIIHLGDVACGFKGREDKLESIFKILTGHKILIKGNHDTRDNDFYYNLGFEKIHEYFIINNILLSHYPLITSINDKKEVRDKIYELFEVFSSKNCSYHIHGHTHRKHSLLPFAFNCSVERINYTPITIEKCLENLKPFQRNFEGI